VLLGALLQQSIISQAPEHFVDVVALLDDRVGVIGAGVLQLEPDTVESLDGLLDDRNLGVKFSLAGLQVEVGLLVPGQNRLARHS